MEGLTHQGNPTLLREIYTDLYITQGGRGEVNEEHEVRQIERASWGEAVQDKPNKCSDVFDRLSKQVKPSSAHVKPSSKEVKHMQIVLTKGVAGIGKTVSVQKLIMDWAEGTSNQDVDFIFPLPFRELNLMKNKTISLVDLIKHFFSEIKDPRVFTSSEQKPMFIFDGLDECRLPLNFSSNPECCDVSKPIPVDVLLTNLIKGNLLPSALLWITTRPAAANQIPSEYVNQVTEIRGFNDPQKEEYFRKKLSDERLASRVIAHLKSSRSLYIMCHIPVFSWISATVVERTSDESGSIEMPRTLTQMYTHFLFIQVTNKNTKYTELEVRDEEMIFKLGKLAFRQLEKGNLIFYEGDLRECGINVTEASVYSGVCTQIFREEAGKLFSFVHLSMQEFLAALYVFLYFSNKRRKNSDQHQYSALSALFRASTLQDLHETAVDLALQSRNGHLDLFLRFLLGLSLESNQNLLRPLMPQNTSQSQSSKSMVQLVKSNIRDYSNRGSNRYHSGSDRQINLFYCLNELNQHAVVEHIDRTSGTLSVEMLLPGQWETRQFIFKTSEEYLEGFDLKKYIKTPEVDQTELLRPDDVLQKLTDVFTSSTSAQ
ncbi:NLR family CARD domain-containing protein 3-like [Engraulis encrasicolus]|uniref:NLR family CARD domain-containing protein 3-like n=1 Tax=Engraulis encrasicolus TaxID=184585 RepID=UPI002FD23E8F